MNWRAIFVLVALGAMAVFGWRWYAQAYRPGAIVEPGEVQYVLAIGDSLTAGVGNDNVSRYWPEILAEKLGASGAVRLAHQGDTASQAFGRWELQIRSKRWKDNDPDWQPDLVVICLGGNDVRRGTGRSALEHDLNRWAEALKPLDVPVLLVAVPGGVLGPLDVYSGLWEEVARRHGMYEMDSQALRRVFTNRDMTVDGIHMNQAGQDFFAEQVHRRVTGRGR